MPTTLLTPVNRERLREITRELQDMVKTTNPLDHDRLILRGITIRLEALLEGQDNAEGSVRSVWQRGSRQV